MLSDNLPPSAGEVKSSPSEEERPGIASSQTPIAEGNPFRRFWGLGYRRLLPVLPSDAGIRYAGKRPGLLGGAGWYGTSVTIFDATLADLDRWMAMGADVGLRCNDGLFFIDIDTRARELAARIMALALEMLGAAKPRYGRKPKVALLYAGDPATNYRQARFDDGMDEKKPGLVELLAGPTKWAKTWGLHPDTGLPYEWPEGIPARHELTFVTAEQLDAFFAALADLLPKWKGATGSSGIDRATVDQDTLRGDPALIRKAMEALPNDREHFGYEEWVRIAIALRAALPEDENLALDLFADWTEKAGIDAPTEAPDRVFFSTPPPYGIGAGFIYGLAMKHSDGAFCFADQYFEPYREPAPKPKDLFPDDPDEAGSAGSAGLDWIDPTAWEGQPVPVMEWLAEGWIPKNEVTLLYGDGGTGKTLLAQQLGTAAATGRAWLGLVTRPSRVMLFLCEDSPAELHRRQRDIARSTGVSLSDLGNLRIVSRKNDDNLLMTWDRSAGCMKLTDVWKRLRDDAVAFRADVVIIDTLADTFGGSEIDRAQVNSFVKGCLGRLAAEIAGTVIALGHPSRAGNKEGDGTSGSTGWSNAVRSRLLLKHLKEDVSSPVRELTSMKANYGAKGAKIKLRWSRGAFEVIGSTMSSGRGSDGLPGSVSLHAATEGVVVSILLERPGERLVMTRNSPYFAPKVLKRVGGELTTPFDQDEMEAAVRRMLSSGALHEGIVGRDTSRRPVSGLVLNMDKLSVETPGSASAFG